MRASETEPAAVGAFPRRPSIVPSLKLTETERSMLGLSSLPATTVMGIEPEEGPPLVTTCPASPTAGPTTSGAQEEVDRLLPGTADDLDDVIATGTPCAPTVSTTPSSAATTAAPTPVFAFEPFRGRWHYGQPVLARYRNTPNFYSGNIATYLGAGLFMVVFDDGTLDYRVRREDLMIVTQDESNGGVDTPPNSLDGGSRSSTPLDASASLAPPNHQLMVDFSASPPCQVVLPVDGGFGGRQEVEQDEFYSRYPHLCPSEPTVVRSLHDSATDMTAILPPSIPDETAFMKQLENGVAFEEDSTQVSDSDDSDEEDMDDGGELMTPWQQMTQTFGMKTLRPRATRRSSVSSVSQVERMSTRLTKQGSMNNVLLSPKSFKQMISDYLSKHSKKVRPSGSQAVSSMDGSAGRVELTPQEWLEQMLTRLDAIEHDGAPAVFADSTVAIASTSGGSGESTASSVVPSRSSHGHARAVPTPVTLPSAATTMLQRVVYERRTDGARMYGTVKARLASGDFAVVTEDEQMITVQAFPPSALLFLPSTAELARQIRCLAHGNKELYAGRRVQVTLYPGSRFSGNGLIVVEKRRKHGAPTLPRRQSTSTPVPAPTTDSTQSDSDQPVFHVLLQNRIRLHNVPADKLIPMMEKHRRQARASITDDQFLICSNKTKVFIGDQVLVKCAGDAEGATTEEKVGVLNGVYSNRTAAIDFADGSTGYEVLPHRISKRKKPRYPQADQDVLSLKNAVLMQARSGNAVGNGSGSSCDSGGRDHASHRLPHTTGEVDYSLPYDVIEEGFQVLADHPRRATVEKCVVIKTHPSSACDLRFADGMIAFEVFPSQMVLESVDRRPRQRRRSRSRPRLRRTRSGRTLDETEDEGEDEDEEQNEWEPRIGEYVLAWSSRFGRFCSAKVSGRAASSNTSTGPTAAAASAAGTHVSVAATAAAAGAPPSRAFFSVVFDYGEQRTNMPIERLARMNDADVLLPTQKLTNYSIDTMGFELWSVGFSVGEAVMARVHGSATYFPGVVEYVYDATAGSAGNSSNSGSNKARRGSNKSAHVGPRVCGVLFDSGERDPRVPFTSAFSVDPRHRFLHGVHASNTRGSSSSGKGNHGATGLVNNGMTIALGLGLGGVSIASNDQLILQGEVDGGGATQRTTSIAMMPTAITGDGNNSVVSPTNRQRRVSNSGSVGSMIMSMAGSFFGLDEESETNPRRASQLLTEIGARLMRRRSSS